MKKRLIILLVCLMFAVPCYAVNVVDTIVYKKVVLKLIHRTILVNRFTGEVKYTLHDNGTWIPVSKGAKATYQSMYDRQVSSDG